MLKNKIKNNNYILNLLHNCVKKKGKGYLSKNILLNSFINIVNNNDNFIKLIENSILDLILPYKIIQKKNKYEKSYNSTYKSISNILIGVINNLKKNKKRMSFDFYFKNEIYKIINKNSNLNLSKSNFIKLFNNINYNYNNTEKKLESNLNINFILNNKNTTEYINKHITYSDNFKYYFNNNRYKYNINYKKNIQLIDIDHKIKYLVKIL